MSDPEESLIPPNRAPQGLARIALWLAGSALVGSAALVLWNRRALKSMQDAAENPVEVKPIRDDDGIY
jgi:hypothetical protein